jgi:hypothetical protein
MAKSHKRGHEIYYDFDLKDWKYSDTGESANIERQCKKCGRMPTKDGYDFCIGKLNGVSSACCGHGISNPILVFEKEEING